MLLIRKKKTNKEAELKTLIQKVEDNSTRRFGAVLKRVQDIKLPEPKIVEITKPVEFRTETIREVVTKEIDPEALSALEEDVRRLKNRGGGSMNRQILIGSIDPLTKYTDINFKAGSNITLTYADNSATKKVDITIAGSASGSGITRSINSVSVDTNAGSTAGTDYVYLVSGTTTLTLPTAVGTKNQYTIKNVGIGTVTVATTGGQTIDSSLTASLPIQYTSIDLESDNANWNVT